MGDLQKKSDNQNKNVGNKQQAIEVLQFPSPNQLGKDTSRPNVWRVAGKDEETLEGFVSL